MTTEQQHNQTAAPAVQLTDEEIENLWWGKLDNRSLGSIRAIIAAHEAKLIAACAPGSKGIELVGSVESGTLALVALDADVPPSDKLAAAPQPTTEQSSAVAPAVPDGLAEHICNHLCEQEYDIGIDGRAELLKHVRDALAAAPQPAAPAQDAYIGADYASGPDRTVAYTLERPAQDAPGHSRECRVISYVPGKGEVTFHVTGGVPAFMDVGNTIFVSATQPEAQDAPGLDDAAVRDAYRKASASGQLNGHTKWQMWRDAVLWACAALQVKDAPGLDERALFELAYAKDWQAASPLARKHSLEHLCSELREMRVGDTYGEGQSYLNFKWEGWQARAALAAKGGAA